MSLQQPSTRPGYILLISILIIGVIATAIVASLLLLGISSNRTSLSVQQSAQAFAIATGCAEYALLQLHDSIIYAGDETLLIGNGACEILPLGGVGNRDRAVCVEARVGSDIVRRLEIIVQRVLPQIRIASWREVTALTLCG